ncbi:helix-turn-helix transcriptional regulator, partial [Streptomyces boncukensis]
GPSPDLPDLPDLADAVPALLRRGCSVREVAREVGLSERQLHRRCLHAFGYGAKTLDRVLRMRRALALAEGGTPLSETAVRAGYADQAHLAREVRSLAGTSLTGLIRP